MKKGGGKQKGAAFEREVCRKLSLWLSEGKHEDYFWRSAMSGGRSTVAHAKGKRLAAQAGDISCIHPGGQKFADKYLIECKFYQNLHFDGLVTGHGKLLEFWQVLHVQASVYGKMPFLVAKQNRVPAVICLNLPGRVMLAVSERNCMLYSFRYDMYILEADYFFKSVRPYI